jgi:hypothetical protein
MTSFESVVLPSGSPLFYGHLSFKASFFSPRCSVQVFLARPSEIADVKVIHDSILSRSLADPWTEPKDLTLYGHVTLSALSGFPLLVLLNSKKLSVIHFSQVEAVRDEIDLQTACALAIVSSGGAQHKFLAETSTDYQ